MIVRLSKIIENCNFITKSYDVEFFCIDNTDYAVLNCEIDIDATKTYLVVDYNKICTASEYFKPKNSFASEPYLSQYSKKERRGGAIIIINITRATIMQAYLFIDNWNACNDSDILGIKRGKSFVIIQYYESAYLLRIPSLDFMQISGTNTEIFNKYILTMPTLAFYDEYYDDFTLYDNETKLVYDLSGFFSDVKFEYEESGEYWHFNFIYDYEGLRIVATKNGVHPIFVKVEDIINNSIGELIENALKNKYYNNDVI